MFAGKKNRPKQQAGANRSLAQLGLMQIPDLDVTANMDEMLEDEGDLEAELNAMISNSDDKPRKSPPKRPQMGLQDIKKMTEACMQDDFTGDEDVDENDEDLLLELQQFSEMNDHDNEEINSEVVPSAADKPSPPPQGSLGLLEDRLSAYVAEEKEATNSGESGRARRYKRAIKTLQDQIKMVKAGKTVNQDEIPPQPPRSARKPEIPESGSPAEAASIHTSTNEPDTSNNLLDKSTTSELPRHETKTPPSGLTKQTGMNASESKNIPDTVSNKVDDSYTKNYNMLMERRNQYKDAALQCKRDGNKADAIKYIGIFKQFDAVIAALENGQPVDLSGMPPPPEMLAQASANPDHANITAEQQNNINATHEAEAPQFVAPATPAAIIEGLEQRRQKFMSIATAAKEEGNNSKARRVQRIVKQYEEAIRYYKAGKHVDMDELPNAPGFPPIPKETISVSSPPSQKEPSTSDSLPVKKSSPEEKPMPPQPPPRSRPQASKAAGSSKPPLKRNLSTVASQQLNFLMERQSLFRKAAIECKGKGEMQSAKEYLRISKGMDPLIEASQGGLPVDLKTVPIPPQLKEDFQMVEVSDCVESIGEDKDLYESLEKDLIKQLKTCLTNRKILNEQGDVASAAKFENLAVETKKDIQVIRNSSKRNDPVPKFHYETRTFSMVRCNSDLNAQDMELTIIRGIDIPGSQDLYSYIQYEFPQPSDKPQVGKTSTVKNTKNPEYNAKIVLVINRKSRSTVRLFNRNSLKIEVWSKGGFLSKDSLIGTIKVPISQLESKCSIHDSYDVMNGRKATNGKVEIKVRIKEPLTCKEVEKLKERWLVIGS